MMTEVTLAPDIGAQIDSLRADRIAGKVSDRDYHDRMSQLGPQWTGPTAAPAPQTQPEAQASISALMKRRTEGQVSDQDFFSQMEALGPTATPHAELSPEIQRQYDEAMTPPNDPNGYQFEYPQEHEVTPESMAWDAEIRTTFHETGVPQLVAAPIFSSVEQLGRRFADAAPEAIKTHQESVAALMRKQWGTDFDRKIAAVDALINGLRGKVGDTLRAAPWLLADVHALTSLDNLLQHRSRVMQEP